MPYFWAALHFPLLILVNTECSYTSNHRNLSLSLAAGNATLWKPSQTTPLCAVAVTKIISEVLERNSVPGAVAGLVIGGKDVGEALVESRDVDMGICIIQVSTFNEIAYISMQSLSQAAKKPAERSPKSCSPASGKFCLS